MTAHLSWGERAPEDGAVIRHAPDDRTYNRPDEAMASRLGGRDKFVTVPAGRRDGASKGFDHNAPAPVIIDPQYNGGGVVVDPAALTNAEIEHAMATSQDPHEAYTKLAGMPAPPRAAAPLSFPAPAPAPFAFPQPAAAPAAAPQAPAPALPQAQPPTFQAAPPWPAQPASWSPPPAGWAPPAPPPPQPQPQPDPAVQLLAAQVAQLMEGFTRLTHHLSQQAPPPVPAAAPPLASRGHDAATRARALASGRRFSAGSPAVPGDDEGDEDAPARVSARPATADSRSALPVPWAEGDRIPSPRVQVVFELPGLGNHAAWYHDVVDTRTSLWLVYDSRHEGGAQFVPQPSDVPLRVTVRARGVEPVSYQVISGGIQAALFGDALDVVMLLKSSDPPPGG